MLIVSRCGYCACIAFCALVITGCGKGQPIDDSAAEPKGVILLTGSSTVAPVVQEIAQQFEKLHKGAQIDVQTGGSSRGISDATEGVANLGMASRELTREEAAVLSQTTIALDGIAMIVHKNNPIEALAKEQIIMAYTGKYAKWRDFGVDHDYGVILIHKAEGRATLDVFLSYTGLENTGIHPDIIAGENMQVIKTVAENPGALGYVSIGTAIYEKVHGAPIKLLPIEGIHPTFDNVLSGDYPIMRPLTLIVHGAPSGLTKAFLEYCVSPDVDTIIRSHYFVPSAKR